MAAQGIDIHLPRHRGGAGQNTHKYDGLFNAVACDISVRDLLQINTYFFDMPARITNLRTLAVAEAKGLSAAAQAQTSSPVVSEICEINRMNG